MIKPTVISVVFVLFIIFQQKATAHDIHISYAQAELCGGGLKVKVSYYRDDFTKAVKIWYRGKADNVSSQEFQAAEFEYVKNYFRVWADGDYQKQIAPELVKLSDDGTSVIFELQFTANFNTLIIDQRVLFKEYGDQMNIFFIKAFAKEENHIFTRSKPTLLVKP